MSITNLLKKLVDDTYGATLGMLDLVEDDALGWAPESGTNWMTTGQVLKHLETSCGFISGCFVTGDWSALQGMEGDDSQRDPETGLMPASALPTTNSVAATRVAIEADKEKILKAIDEAGEERLANEECAAPWNPTPRTLGYNLFECVQHLGSHKAQLFYYLKLQGKPVHTGTLWGV